MKRKITTDDIFPGGMMTMLIIERLVRRPGSKIGHNWESAIMRTGTFTLKRGAAALTLAMSGTGRDPGARRRVLAEGRGDNGQDAQSERRSGDSGADVGLCELHDHDHGVRHLRPGDGAGAAADGAARRHDADRASAATAWRVPTSLVINGLIKPMTPVWTDGASGPRGADLTTRVRSFDAEAAPNNGTRPTTPGASSP